jgi:hypothetical protein
VATKLDAVSTPSTAATTPSLGPTRQNDVLADAGPMAPTKRCILGGDANTRELKDPAPEELE